MESIGDNPNVELIILSEIMKKLNNIEEQMQEIQDKIQEPVVEQKVYKLKEVQELLQLGQSKTYEILRTGELKSFKVGSEYRVPAKAIEEYMKNQGVK